MQPSLHEKIHGLSLPKPEEQMQVSDVETIIGERRVQIAQEAAREATKEDTSLPPSIKRVGKVAQARCKRFIRPSKPRQLTLKFEDDGTPSESEKQAPKEVNEGPIDGRTYTFPPHRHIDWLHTLHQQCLRKNNYDGDLTRAEEIRLGRLIPNPDYDPNDPSNDQEFIPNDEKQLWYRDAEDRKNNPPVLGG